MLFDKSELQLQPKKTKEGEVFYQFSRPFAKLIKNQIVEFKPPVVTNALGEVIAANIGNNSSVEVRVLVYPSIKGKGHRLESVKVTGLIEYDPEVVITPDSIMSVELPPI